MNQVSHYTPEIVNEYLKKGYWDHTTVYQLWERNAKKFADREAVVDSRIRLTWKKAKEWIDALAAAFVELGIQKGQVLVIQLPNCAELCLLRVACERAGVICLPVSRTLRQREMEYILGKVEAVGIVIPYEFRGFNYFEMVTGIRPRLPGLKHIFIAGDRPPQGTVSLDEIFQKAGKVQPNRIPADRAFKSTEVSFINLTSGTTGFPKFVSYPAAARMTNAKEAAQRLSMTENDVVTILADAAGGPNITAYFGAPWVGAKILVKWFETEEVLKMMQDEHVTVLSLVPAILAMIVKHPEVGKYNLSSIRVWQSGGAPLPTDLSKIAEKVIGGKVVNGYGAVDFGGMSQCTDSDPQDIRLYTVGKLFTGNEARLVDENGKDVPPGQVGELWARGPVNPAGYYGDPEATRQAWKDGWFKMGDLARYDKNGNLVIEGRQKDIIIRGGQNIFPSEIENLLINHPKIAYVALVGYPDPGQVMGERACACVVLKADQSLNLNEVVEYLKQKGIAPYKLPERLEIFTSLPILSAEKIDKKTLRQELQKRSEAKPA